MGDMQQRSLTLQMNVRPEGHTPQRQPGCRTQGALVQELRVSRLLTLPLGPA